MTDRYNYLEAVTDDVRDYIRDEIELADWTGDLDGLEEKLNDDLWINDSVTGNASGSYYCNTWRAEEALAHNLDLIAEVAAEFGCEPTISDGFAGEMSSKEYPMGFAIPHVAPNDPCPCGSGLRYSRCHGKYLS
jgi:hypothetical protein